MTESAYIAELPLLYEFTFQFYLCFIKNESPAMLFNIIPNFRLFLQCIAYCIKRFQIKDFKNYLLNNT